MKSLTLPNSGTRQLGVSQDLLLEAAARSALCQAFERLTQDFYLPVVAAAKVLGQCPSTFSGKSSLLARYRRGDLLLQKRPCASRITRLTGALIDGGALFYEGNLLASLDPETEGGE